jgi:hypothetical protein
MLKDMNFFDTYLLYTYNFEKYKYLFHTETVRQKKCSENLSFDAS